MHRHILHVVEEVSQRHKVDGAARLEIRLHHVAHLVVHCVACIKRHNVDAVTKYSFDTISCTRCLRRNLARKYIRQLLSLLRGPGAI